MDDIKNVALVSLGCDKNLLDSEVMIGLLREGGYNTTDDLKNADAIVLNTCGFLESAVAEGFETALELLRYKTKGIGVCRTFVLTGCMATRYKNEIFETIPGVDAIVGAADYDKICDVVGGAKSKSDKSCITDINRNVADEKKLKRVVSTPKHYAYIKIAEGCDNHCTYCTIPSIRGKYRSRKKESLTEEARSLAQGGVKELILVAQDTSRYGSDIYGKSVLHELVREFSEIGGIEFIRILYCYPEHITDELIAEMASNPKVVHYIDMPIQHTEDEVLKRMGRRSTKRQITEVVGKLRAAMPDISIRTTVIAGFPGETGTQFSGMIKFLQDIKFDRLGAFAYSKEEGTPAANLDGYIGAKEREKRAEAVMAAQEDIIAALNEEKLGKVFDVIIDEKLENEDVYCGRTYADAPQIDTLVYIEHSGKLDQGSVVKVKITENDVYDLIGVIDRI